MTVFCKRSGFEAPGPLLLWVCSLSASICFRSEWPVLLGFVVFGIRQGSLVTLLFNVVVTASPKALAGDVVPTQANADTQV
jgi:hypothetical protein